ncbi:hypothetical protein E2C01_069961 [Portunus trituberculatus]|uniref:Uncharacterized protein n=1 Tax=Portunus trituberculatus TaxID=210409 RepID=A0A5B7HRF0_PORTR|nr:hypothetical protein [Portunus trituberculatus]
MLFLPFSDIPLRAPSADTPLLHTTPTTRTPRLLTPHNATDVKYIHSASESRMPRPQAAAP